MTYREMKRYLDDAFSAFQNSLSLVVFSGGEATMLGKILEKAIRDVKRKSSRIVVRIVSNGHWATSQQVAYKTLKRFVSCGLNEINFSTGDEHQRFVPIENIVNGCWAACKLNITCAVNIEYHASSSFTEEMFRDETVVKSILDSDYGKDKFKIISGLWIGGNSFDDSFMEFRDELLHRKGCDSLFSAIAIDPKGRVLSCCGLSTQNHPYLCLNPDGRPWSDLRLLWRSQFDDLLKLWIYEEGPLQILEFIYSLRQEPFPIGLRGKHACELCPLLFKSENLELLRANYRKVLPQIAARQNLRQAQPVSFV